MACCSVGPLTRFRSHLNSETAPHLIGQGKEEVGAGVKGEDRQQQAGQSRVKQKPLSDHLHAQMLQIMLPVPAGCAQWPLP